MNEINKIKVLFLCTGNSCRSQMAEGLCNYFHGESIQAFSAGIAKHGMNQRAIKVMAEIGIDISQHTSKTISELPSIDFDYVITVCSNAQENCPYFPAKVKTFHVSIDDPPALTKGLTNEEEILSSYRKVRDEINDFILKIREQFMDSSEQIKNIVKEKYGEIAKNASNKGIKGPSSACCSSGCGCGQTTDYSFVGEDYASKSGYNPDADLGLGCGIPTDIANIKEGNTVIDLGSGAGNDAFVARSLVGASGKVIGIDFTEEMVKKARENNKKMGYSNIEFLQGEIEKMPVGDHVADVVISNCVLNLVPNKMKAFAEIYRVIKNKGHFSISDIVTSGELPASIKLAAEAYVGCISGALLKADYLKIIKDTGFVNINVAKERKITIPDEMLKSFLTQKEISDFRDSDVGIFSITVYGEKA
ncbi:MAG: arsenite methyltransferase [Oligoflexia bacterium]|nr:arsenite methyltransferase [Oligoflexia bacterium]